MLEAFRESLSAEALIEFDSMLASAREASFGEMDQTALSDALHKALKEKLKSENANTLSDCGGCGYCYVRAIFSSFLIAHEEWYDEGYKSGYYKRPYSVSGTTVTIGSRDQEVELAWVPALTSALECFMPIETRSCEALVTTVERGQPTQEAIAADGDIVNARETTAAFSDAKFNQNVIEGIVPIRPGISKNRKYYGAPMLKRDLAVFNGLPVFYDHQKIDEPKPLKNLIGVLENARWDEESQVPKADLRYPKSMEAVVSEIKDKFALLGADRVGFSIDMSVKAKVSQVQGKVVQTVEALIGGFDASTDIVFNPAAGGGFDKALDAARESKETGMPAELLAALEGVTLDQIRAARPELFPAPTEEPVKVAEAQVAAPVAAQETVSRESVMQMVREEAKVIARENTIRARIAEAKVSDNIKRAMLLDVEAAGFDTVASESAIKSWLDEGAALAGGPNIIVPGMGLRVTESQDKRYARLLGAALGEDQVVDGEKVRAFTKLSEALFAWHPELMQSAYQNPSQFAVESLNYLHWGGGELGSVMESKSREAIMTSTFPLNWADVTNKVLAREVADPELNTWRAIVSDKFSFNDLTNTKKILRVGDYPDIEQVNQGAPYQFIVSPGEEKVEFGISKYGNLEKYTWEAALADDLNVLARIPRKLGQAWAWTVYRFVWSLLTANSGDGATYDPDSKVLYHADHNNNLDSAFSVANLLTLDGKMQNQTDITQTGNFKAGYRPKFLAYANEASLRASVWTALSSQFGLTSSAAEINLPNIIKEVFGLVPIQVYYPNGSTTRYEMIADPRRAQTIAVGFLHGMETPEIFVQDMERVGSVFNSDQITYKIRGTVGGDILDYRSFARGRK